MSCPHGHAHTTDTAPVEVGMSGGGPTLYFCNSQCGDPICEALFKTEGYLRQHIRQRQDLVCTPETVCVCVCIVCVHVCVHVYLCMCVCTCICMCVHVCVHVCVRVCMCGLTH